MTTTIRDAAATLPLTIDNLAELIGIAERFVQALSKVGVTGTEEAHELLLDALSASEGISAITTEDRAERASQDRSDRRGEAFADAVRALAERGMLA